MATNKLAHSGQSLHQAVAEDIGMRILRGAPGALLPNEAGWCRSYKISRTAVREAIIGRRSRILRRHRVPA